MDLRGQAFFVAHPRRLEDLCVPHAVEKERPYRIVAVARLRRIDYENFVSDMLADRGFIEEHSADCQGREVLDCLLVQQYDRADGVLVFPERQRFVSMAAYITE